MEGATIGRKRDRSRAAQRDQALGCNACLEAEVAHAGERDVAKARRAALRAAANCADDRDSTTRTAGCVERQIIIFARCAVERRVHIDLTRATREDNRRMHFRDDRGVDAVVERKHAIAATGINDHRRIIALGR